MRHWYLHIVALVAAVTLLCGVAPTVALAAQSDEAVLTVAVTSPGDDGALRHEFSIEDLRTLPVAQFDTRTIWTSGEQEFTGVSLAALLAHVGVTDAQNGIVVARAINDYAVEIPVADAISGGPMVAYERNGSSMSVRDKGPLWIVYPYDSDPTYRTEAVYSRSIWQLEEITVGQ
ncbi:molybdopterin-dependent oxidoreductase [Phaeobacter porticola]|uniref:Oxidoreductase, molybdopterin binding protein n=1 Tax=Phaeobacter porticola TaxID=1844006 RepID=A0A1L3I5K3_9RHOB|nr:molybdopterin-dependent oxidoreductase [Phaeobacter porticola]APG47373.1 oxidoreductase, molybdopterin binding protein [Phaeobacter porticola]